MQAHRVGQSLGLVAGTAAALVLVVGFVSTAHAQDCNGALNITIPSPKAVPPTGPYLNVGDSTTVKLNLGSGSITGGTQITLRRLRYELDCNHLFALGVPCTDQGTIMSYDFTQTVASGGALVQCQGRTWTATAGSSANEVIFTPDTPIVLPPEQSASPTLDNCFISFKVKLESLEPSSGPNADDTTEKVEVVAGFSTVLTSGHADAECDNGGASGVTQSSGIFTCPSCTVDQCNLGCDTTTGTCTPQQASTPCGDTDGNTCTTAGCELSAGLGVCVQTHLFAENSTPCADSDGNACTTAGCNGQGVCDQNHSSKVCPPADQCNKGCDTTSGQCTPQASTPCTDSDGNTCTTAGCEVSTTNSELGVCVQTHMFASNSTPCADSDNNACTTAGCNGQGTCDQTHMVIQSTSNCANPIVGAATDCTVLELDGSKVDITGPPGGIVGDICIGPNGHLSITGGEFVTGNVRLASGATLSKSGPGTVGGVQNGVDLSAEINAAIAASAKAAIQACTINLTSIMNATTINATGGGTTPTVVCVQDVVLNGRTVTLSGVSGDSFIINVTGKFVLNGGSRIVVSGIQPKDVLYNILGSGQQVAFTGGGGGSGCCKSSADGTLIALHRNIALSPGLINGELIGGQNISIVSGSSVKCPPSPCVP